MEESPGTPSARRPQRIRKKVKYLYDEYEQSTEESTPRAKKQVKKTGKYLKSDDSDEDPDYGKENKVGIVKKDNHDYDEEDEEEEEEETEEISEYEKLRLKNLEENRRVMISLGLMNPKKEEKIKPKLKPKPKPKTAQKKILEPTKRSARLLGKTPEGKDLPITFAETPETSLVEEKTRIEEESLPMNEDGTVTDFLDSLKLSLSQGSSSQSSVEYTDSLIKDMRYLELAKVEKITIKRIQSMCVHPMEGKLLIVAGSSEGELGLLDANNSEVVRFTPHLRPINCVSVSHSNPYDLFTTSFDGTVRRADINKSVIDLVYQTDEKRNMCHVTWHTQIDSTTLIIAHGSGEAGVVDLRTKSAQRWFHCHPRSMRTVQSHPTKPNYFLTSSGSGEAKLWDLRESKKHVDIPVTTLYEGKSLTSAFFSPDGNKVVITGNDDRLRIYDTSDLSNPKELHSILHDNHTGRWLSVFKAIWHTHSSDLFFVGSMLQPRRIQMYSGSGKLVKDIMDEQLATVVPVISLHPNLPIVVGGNSSGKAHIFTTPKYINQYFD